MRQLTVKQKNLLKHHIANGGNEIFYDDLPEDIKNTLEAINNTEILWSEVQRFLGDNRKPDTSQMWG